jgi:co-chaperonin GroES (HSP10)
MSSIPLADTLVALVESLEEARAPGLTVTEATLDVPLEGSVVATSRGPVFVAAPAHTRWRTGFLPPLHLAHFGLAQSIEGE